jgi:hypothetical protein
LSQLKDVLAKQDKSFCIVQHTNVCENLLKNMFLTQQQNQFFMPFTAILGSFEHSQGTQKDRQRPASGQAARVNV